MNALSCLSIATIVLLSGLFGQDTGNRRFSNTFLGYDQNQTANNLIDGSLNQGDFNESLEPNIRSLFSNINNGQHLAAFDYSIDYLIQSKISSSGTGFPINEESLLDAVETITKVFLEEASVDGVDDDLFQQNASRILLENFVTDQDGLDSLNLSISDRINKLSSLYTNALGQTASINAVGSGLSNFFYSTLSLYSNDNPNLIDYNQTDLSIGIEAVSKTDNAQSDVMLFGGTDQFYNFDPAKSNFVTKAANGITEAFIKTYDLDSNASDSNAFDVLSKSLLEGLFNFSSEIGSEENADFTLELLKSTSSGVSQGSTKVLFSDVNLAETGKAIEYSEELSYYLSSNGILTASETGNLGIGYNDIAEAISFGTAMGARLMGENQDKIMNQIDPTLTNPKNTRKLLSKALSSGSSNGSLTAIANIAATDNAIGWENVKEVASQAAKGAMIANVANVIYFGEDDELLPIINFSAQGATYGATKTLALNNVEKPQGLTEDLTVEVARTSSHGSSLGATFAAVGLKSANPVTNENDTVSNKSVQAVAYGATIGSILGASESGNGDPIVVKQASKQGVTEGSLIGSGFATDYQESFFVENDVEDMEIAAKKNILSSINSMNADASLEAMNSLATKKVKTSSRDMLLLIRKFNISPNTTNPATIYQRPTKKKSGDDFPFTDKFPAATPI
ncbi:MAG: hypothetical protein VX609_06130 [Verrucomicrobiota bacterium]|nr:hypothetical protein [Verrucomicrobiota bacterium]